MVTQLPVKSGVRLSISKLDKRTHKEHYTLAIEIPPHSASDAIKANKTTQTINMKISIGNKQPGK